MAQNASVNYRNAAAALVRQPVATFEIEWSAGIWTDETAWLIEASGEQSATRLNDGPSALGASVADRMTVTLRNDDGHFTGKAYDGYGKRCRFSLGFVGTESLVQFIGFLEEPRLTSMGAQITFEALGYAAKANAQRTSTGVYLNLRTDEYLEELRQLLDPPVAWDTGHPYPGSMVLPFAWLDDESIGEQMQQVAEAEGGRVRFSKEGLLRFEPAAYQLVYNQTPQATFTVASFADITRGRDWQNAWNHIKVPYRNRYLAGIGTVYESSETITILPDSSYDTLVRFQAPVVAVYEPEPNIDYTARTAGYGDATSSVSATILSSFAAEAKVRFTNAHASRTVFIDRFSLRGEPVLAGEERSAELVDANWDNVYGRRVKPPIDNVYLQTEPDAAALGRIMLDRFATPRLVLEIQDSPGYPWLDIGDLVTVTEAKTGTSLNGYISRISWQWHQGYTAQYQVYEAANIYPNPASEYFVVGVSAFGDKRTYY